MRIVVHGQQAFGKAVLEALIKRGETVIAAYVAPEKEGAKADPLKEAAIAAKLPVYQPASYRKPEVWEEFKALKPDLQVMAFVTLFVPEEFLNIPTHGSIQYHPSLLPAYRGASAINWPIIKGEKETGLSIFWPDNGLDTGDVLLQKKTPIGPTDTLGTVYFDRLFPMGVEALMESIDLVKAGKAPRVKQDESKATYEGVSALTEAVESTQPNVSKHLKLMQDAGLLARRQEGNTVYYSIADPTVFDLCEVVCSSLQERFAAHASAFAAAPLSRARRN
ncbi:MAG: ArsR family transcriptional regulator [Acidobacteria bacterium]|nr:ArsR family transcriptional regulator [Acidobacteriota bacterium]